MSDSICKDCRLYLIRFPACLPIDATLVHKGEENYVTKCRNKAKNKSRKCGICQKLELKVSLKPINTYAWILKEGKEKEVKPNLLGCQSCRQKMAERTKEVKKVARRLDVSARFLKSMQPWIQDGRAPTIEEYSSWARGQHKRACKEYRAAFPLDYYDGKCQHRVEFGRPCAPFFSHTGICETGYFVPERIRNLGFAKFNKQARKADRIVKKELHG